MRNILRYFSLLALVGGFLPLVSSAQDAAKSESPADVKIIKNEPYVKDGHERQKLDLFVPQSDKPLPVIVWIHGGGWRAGSKENSPALLFGGHYAIASINYRFSNHAVFPAQIEDCRAAIRWLRGHAKEYNLDPEHIGVWGASAGGHLVALLGTTPEKKEWDSVGEFRDQSAAVQCVVDWFGPSDFRKVEEVTIPKDNPVITLLGGRVADKLELATAASPIAHVKKGCPPFLITHGTKDSIVRVEASTNLGAALKEHGNEVTLDIVEGGLHGGPQFNTEGRRTMIRDFFDKHLRGGISSEEK